MRTRALRLVTLACICSVQRADDSIPIVLGDGTTQRLQLGWFPRDTHATEAFCSKYSVSSDDCATLYRHVTAKRDGLGRFFVAATEAAAAAMPGFWTAFFGSRPQVEQDSPPRL